MRLRLCSTHPDATAAVGSLIADLLAPGDVIMLTGPLGAGKTRLVQGVAVGLGIEGRVTSPTFVLVRRHEAAIPLVHVDAYRLSDARDLLRLDDDVLDASVITCVEWGDVVRDALPADRLECDVQVDGDHGEAPRTITIEAIGPAWASRAVQLRGRCIDIAHATDDLMLMEVQADT